MQASTLLVPIQAHCPCASGQRRTSAQVLPAVNQRSTRHARSKLFGLVVLVLLLDISVTAAIDPETPVRKSVAPPPVSDVESTIPPLSVRTMAGDRIVLRFSSDERPTVLYFISPACIWCERNVPNIRQLAHQSVRSFRFVAVSLATLPAGYRQGEDLGFEIVTHSNPVLLATYGVRGTPYTLVVSPQGRVLKAWPGAYGGAVRADVERFFHVQLPPMQ